MTDHQASRQQGNAGAALRRRGAVIADLLELYFGGRHAEHLSISERLPMSKALSMTKGLSMSKAIVKPRTKLLAKTQRPPLYKVILLNDDYTPRDFVVLVLKAVFRMNADQAYRVMMTAHQKGACVIAVYTRDVAETKAKEATELGKQKGYPLFFTTEPEE
jgi:ATP-dependent Clp protease adaptor protein ClpS